MIVHHEKWCIRKLLFILIFFLVLVSGCSANSLVASRYEGNTSLRKDGSSIILVGDTQRTSIWETLLLREQNDEAREAVVHKIAGENPGALVILGDLVSDGSNEEEWHRFDEFLSPVRQMQIPVYPVLGNHDYFGNNQKALDNFFSRFPHLQQRSWSALVFQSVGIILLNSNFDELTDAQRQEQTDWYRKTLEQFQRNDSIRAVIVTCHHPPFTNSKIVSDNTGVQEYFVKPYIQTPKAKVFFTGHCHSYEHFRKEGKNFVVSGGGGGPRQAVESDSSKQHHQDLFNGKEIRDFHYCKVTIEGDRLRIQMIRVDKSLTGWSTGDEFTIEY